LKENDEMSNDYTANENKAELEEELKDVAKKAGDDRRDDPLREKIVLHDSGVEETGTSPGQATPSDYFSSDE